MNVSKELYKLYQIKSQLNEVITVFQSLVDAQNEELINSQAVQQEIAISEVDDIVSDSYRKAMLFSALEQEKLEQAVSTNLEFIE